MSIISLHQLLPDFTASSWTNVTHRDRRYIDWCDVLKWGKSNERWYLIIIGKSACHFELFVQCDLNHNLHNYRKRYFCDVQDILLILLCPGITVTVESLVTSIQGHSVCNPKLARGDRIGRLGAIGKSFMQVEERYLTIWIYYLYMVSYPCL